MFRSHCNDPNRFEIIPCEKERMQILHHSYLGDLQSTALTVGNSKEILSCTRMKFERDLMEAYDKTLSLIFDLCLKPFYDAPADGKDLVASEEFMERFKEAVEINKESLVDVKTVMFNFKFWKRATERCNLPLPPCKQIIPLAHSSWNRGKPGSDINTQMLWEQNFPAPIHSAQNALVKTMLILQPAQAIHRLVCIAKGGDKIWTGSPTSWCGASSSAATRPSGDRRFHELSGVW